MKRIFVLKNRDMASIYGCIIFLIHITPSIII